MFTSLGGPQWPVWAVQAGIVGVGLSVLSGLFCGIRFVLKLEVPRSWIIVSVALFAVSVVAIGLALLFMYDTADTVR